MQVGLDKQASANCTAEHRLGLCGLNTKGLAFEWVTVDDYGYSFDLNYVSEKICLS